MDKDEARDFVASNHRAVMVTHGSGGKIQTSPVTIGVNETGHAVISSRETAYKVKNLERDPSVTLCVMNDRFYGDWIQIDGRAEIVHLPDAMDGLIDYYRRISGEHPDWDDYRNAMERERRVLIRVDIEHAGPDRRG